MFEFDVTEWTGEVVVGDTDSGRRGGVVDGRERPRGGKTGRRR